MAPRKRRLLPDLSGSLPLRSGRTAPPCLKPRPSTFQRSLRPVASPLPALSLLRCHQALPSLPQHQQGQTRLKPALLLPRSGQDQQVRRLSGGHSILPKDSLCAGCGRILDESDVRPSDSDDDLSDDGPLHLRQSSLQETTQ